ncbi:MAG: protogloblin ApPgb [Actinomyces sp.]|nr:MAG: protogloblin ApPgb [Actinomyces sp.]
MATTTIPGYRYGQVDPSPVTETDLDLLKQTLLWTDDDTAALRRAGEILAGRVDDVLDLWYGYVGSHPHLVRYFNGADGEPDPAYLDAVRVRFGQWIRDLCTRPHDADWLAYQEEIARRHLHDKGRTDGIATTEPFVPLRYMIAFIWPITATIRDFLAAGTDDPDEVDAMHRAWFKAVTLSVVLWSRPYAPELW